MDSTEKGKLVKSTASGILEVLSWTGASSSSLVYKFTVTNPTMYIWDKGRGFIFRTKTQ